MKGVSAIIATILLLMITIGLAGSAYVFISGMLTGKTRSAFEILDSSDYLLIVKNIGTEPIDKFTAVVDNKNVDVSIKEGSIPVNGVGTVILEDINLGTHNLMINTPSMSQRWRWDYKSPYSVVETQFFSQGASDWTAIGGSWSVQSDAYHQDTLGMTTHSYTNVNTDFNATYEVEFTFLTSTSLSIVFAASTSQGAGIETVFDKSNSQIRLLHGGTFVDSYGPISFTDSRKYSVKIEVGNGPYKLYLDGQHISGLDNTLNPTWIQGKYLQLIANDTKANFDNIIVGSLSSVATTTTSTTGTTTTSTSTTSTAGTTTTSTSTTTTVGTTTTSTSTSTSTSTTTTSSTTTTAPSCSSCPSNTCQINCGNILLGRSTLTQEYFNFTLSSPRNVTITVTPDPVALFDLYLNWTAATCPTTNNWNCRPLRGTGVPQICSCPGTTCSYPTALPAGTYYFMVKYTQPGTYDLNLTCV
jgi:flagellin-like protein